MPATRPQCQGQVARRRTGVWGHQYTETLPCENEATYKLLSWGFEFFACDTHRREFEHELMGRGALDGILWLGPLTEIPASTERGT